MKKIYSFYDNKNKLYVDCTECNRGVNGADPDKCSAGFKCKRPNHGGCFIGEILSSIPLSQIKHLT